MLNDFTKNSYLLCHLPSVQEVKPYFNSLKIDPYYGSYKYKAASRFNFIDDEVILLPHDDFIQSKDYNPVAGGIARSYPPIDDRIVNSSYLFLLFKKISKHIELSLDSCFTVHQIRVVTSNNISGLAAAEGIHQDGYDFIALSCISRKNIVGGTTSLYSEVKQKVFEKELDAGDVLIVNDRKLFHYTTPITNLSSKKGSRDMLIVTVSLSGACDTP